MLNVWSSINDPLFYLHHGNLDRIWSIWQKQPGNLNAMGGPVYPNGTGETTLDSLMYMSEFIAPSLPTRKVMDTLNKDDQGILCYVYEDDHKH
jgi:tyrosinase